MHTMKHSTRWTKPNPIHTDYNHTRSENLHKKNKRNTQHTKLNLTPRTLTTTTHTAKNWPQTKSNKLNET